MSELPKFKYFHNNKSDTLDVILHGISEGIDSRLISKLLDASYSKGNSVIAFNFKFLERGEKKSSGEELLEERESLQKILDFCGIENYSYVRLIGKSFGGILLARYLSELPDDNQKKFSAIMLAYDTGYINIKNFTGKIRIIQGSRDKYGDIEVVKKDIEGVRSTEIEYFSIEGASHSYCNPETDEPIYENEAVRLAIQ